MRMRIRDECGELLMVNWINDDSWGRVSVHKVSLIKVSAF